MGLVATQNRGEDLWLWRQKSALVVIDSTLLATAIETQKTSKHPFSFPAFLFSQPELVVAKKALG